MHKAVLFSILTVASPLVLAGQTNIHPLEQCGIGSTCSYNLAGHSQRVISMSGLQAKKMYVCSTSGGNGQHFTVGYVSSTNGARIHAGPTGDLRSPFVLYGPPKGEGSLSFSLRNNDLWGMEHRIRFHCEAES